MRRDCFKYYFVGIGGASLSGLAESLKGLGHEVRGSDLNDGEVLDRLREKGIKCFIGHEASNVPKDVDFLVRTSTVSNSNPEVEEARRFGASVLERWELINQISRGYKWRVSVTGSVGKTTTACLTWFALSGNMKCDYIVGANIGDMPSAKLSRGGHCIVIESDESDGGFANIESDVVILNRIEFDHIEHSLYGGSRERFFEVFEDFIREHVESDGVIIYLKDCKILSSMVKKACRLYGRLYSYSQVDSGADFYAKDVVFDASYLGAGEPPSPGVSKFNFCSLDDGLTLFDVELPMFGLYNVQNAVAALACCRAMSTGVSSSQFSGLHRFDKRFNIVGSFGEAVIVDDYAHSPLKVKTLIESLEVVKKTYGLLYVCVFEPHKYSRLHFLYSEYMSCLAEATGLVVLMDIFNVAGYVDSFGIDKESFERDLRMNCPNLKLESVSNSDIFSYLHTLISGMGQRVLIVFFGAGRSSFCARNLEKELKLIEGGDV